MTAMVKEASDNARPQPPTPEELISLAKTFDEASERLQKLWTKGKPLSHAPFRFMALHAIELYLSAYLQLRNHDPKKIRGLQHDLKERSERAKAAGLILRKRTIAHLSKLTTACEYTGTRYKPATLKNPAPPNELLATLNDVRTKVMAAAGEVYSGDSAPNTSHAGWVRRRHK